MADDRNFLTALERAYLVEVRRRAGTGLSPLVAHRAALAAAIAEADPTNGGIRFRRLDAATRAELDERLFALWSAPRSA